ncbi:MAG: thermonuclease family protein, partial [Anaerolineales bacterium]|nr:thermonuclease family protein [Anaerolineales bacterium]
MSKKYTAYCLLFTVYFLTGCVVGVETAVSSPPRTTSSIPPGDRATVDFVIDGDTVDVLLGGESYRVRYIGVDTPERDEPFYAEATAANAALVDGAEVILVRDVSETDQYGRLLRYVYLPNGTFVNAELVAQGYARVVTF